MSVLLRSGKGVEYAHAGSDVTGVARGERQAVNNCRRGQEVVHGGQWVAVAFGFAQQRIPRLPFPPETGSVPS